MKILIRVLRHSAPITFLLRYNKVLGCDGEEIAYEASDAEEPGVGGEVIAEEATPDFEEDFLPAESGGWMK